MADRTRRNFLRNAAGATASAFIALSSSASCVDAKENGGGNQENALPTFVFVHGTNCSSFWWTGLIRELALRGHRSLAVDLPGHGYDAYFPASYQAPEDIQALANEPSPLSKVTLDDYVDHVVGIVRQVRQHGPVILVGHSMGGLTVSRVGNVIPDLLARIVYVSAFCCVDMPTLVDYLGSPEGSTSLGPTIPAHGALADPAKLGVVRYNWRSGDPQFLAAAKATFAGGFSDIEFRAILNMLEPDESATIPLSSDGRGHADTWGRIPRTYVRFARDRLIPAALQDRMIAEADRLTPNNRFDVRTVGAPHAGPLHRPDIVSIFDGLV